MEYISVKEASLKWGISERRIQRLCLEERVAGAIRFRRGWRRAQGLDDTKRCRETSRCPHKRREDEKT